MIEELRAADGNEAETRRRVERLFESLMGYNALKHITREHAIQTSGDADYVDFAIQASIDPKASIDIIVELKRVGIDLKKTHLKQAESYAVNTGVNWILLTNSRQWKLYHVEFGRPPETRLIAEWNLLEDDPVDAAEGFELVSYKSVRSGKLEKLWDKTRALATHNLLSAIHSEESLKLLRRMLRKSTDVMVEYDDIVVAIPKLLNESSLRTLDDVKISIPSTTRKRPAKTDSD